MLSLHAISPPRHLYANTQASQYINTTHVKNVRNVRRYSTTKYVSFLKCSFIPYRTKSQSHFVDTNIETVVLNSAIAGAA